MTGNQNQQRGCLVARQSCCGCARVAAGVSWPATTFAIYVYRIKIT